MITCKYSSGIKKQFLIYFILIFFSFILYYYISLVALGNLLRDFFSVYNNINPAEYKKIFAIFFLTTIMLLAYSIAFFKELNWYRNAIFEIWDNKLICRYKNKETVINYKDINYMIISNMVFNNIYSIVSVNYGSNKKMQFRSSYFENKENADILMPYFEITKTEPYWFLLKKVFVKVKEII